MCKKLILIIDLYLAPVDPPLMRLVSKATQVLWYVHYALPSHISVERKSCVERKKERAELPRTKREELCSKDSLTLVYQLRHTSVVIVTSEDGCTDGVVRGRTSNMYPILAVLLIHKKFSRPRGP